MKAIFFTGVPLISSGGRLETAIAFYRITWVFQSGGRAKQWRGIRRSGIEFNPVENDNRDWTHNTGNSSSEERTVHHRSRLEGRHPINLGCRSHLQEQGAASTFLGRLER